MEKHPECFGLSHQPFYKLLYSYMSGCSNIYNQMAEETLFTVQSHLNCTRVVAVIIGLKSLCSGLWGAVFLCEGGPSSATDSLWPCYRRLERKERMENVSGGHRGSGGRREKGGMGWQMMRAERGHDSVTAGALQSRAAWHSASIMKSCAVACSPVHAGMGGARGRGEKEEGCKGREVRRNN